MRASLGTEDFDEAHLRLAQWMLDHLRPQNAAPAEALLSVILNGYLADKTGMPSYAQAEIAITRFNAFWHDKTVAEVTPQEQERYINDRRKAGVSTSTIARELGVLRAALRHARAKGEITAEPFVKNIQTAEDMRAAAPKGRPLSLREMAALFNATKTKRVRRYLMILCNTLCRPGAGLELTRSGCCDFENRLVHLNQPGRRQNKKYRPTVPMTKAVRPWLKDFKGDRFMAYGNQRVQGSKNLWRRLRADAGLGDDVNGYSVRHTMARELRRRGVPGEQIELMLGHRRPTGQSATTAGYAPYDPAFCQDAVAAIDGYMRELAKLVRFPLIGPKVATLPEQAPRKPARRRTPGTSAGDAATTAAAAGSQR